MAGDPDSTTPSPEEEPTSGADTGAGAQESSSEPAVAEPALAQGAAEVQQETPAVDASAPAANAPSSVEAETPSATPPPAGGRGGLNIGDVDPTLRHAIRLKAEAWALKTGKSARWAADEPLPDAQPSKELPTADPMQAAAGNISPCGCSWMQSIAWICLRDETAAHAAEDELRRVLAPMGPKVEEARKELAREVSNEVNKAVRAAAQGRPSPVGFQAALASVEAEGDDPFRISGLRPRDLAAALQDKRLAAEDVRWHDGVFNLDWLKRKWPAHALKTEGAGAKSPAAVPAAPPMAPPAGPPAAEESASISERSAPDDDDDDESGALAEDAVARHPGGRPAEINWAGAKAHVDRIAARYGRPLPRKKDGTPNLARVVGIMERFLKKNEPPPWPGRPHIYRWLRDHPEEQHGWFGSVKTSYDSV
jgi:hypothetical protein